MSVREPEKLFGIDFQNYCICIMSNSQKKEYAYKRAIKNIEKFTTLIDDENKFYRKDNIVYSSLLILAYLRKLLARVRTACSQLTAFIFGLYLLNYVLKHSRKSCINTLYLINKKQ